MNAMAPEDCAAALLLLSWKHHLIVDPQTARELEQDRHRLQSLPSPPHSPPSHGRYFPRVAALHGLVGECSPPWEKQLKGSDLLKGQRRLLLKQSYAKQYLYPLLSSREIDKLKRDGILVNVYDGEGNMYEMIFKLWGTKAHVLTSDGWLEFYRDHNLIEEIDWITIWMFKHVHTHQLCFAIVSERRPQYSTLPAVAGKSSNNRKRSRNTYT
ncbi:TF-B3 domain-containing protein [Heracleum sosnowskyi]|uniref:TF-B3 domain-containing protein n=1 Tax=Heracleum sosnowskyi TaxID=360622 RepID=A0AAD8J3S5_9APIA|nr:TF-B3 domain-containing protein [Heracleum sosnowskyi]